MLAAVLSMQSISRLLASTVVLGALRVTSRSWNLQPNALTSNTWKLVFDQVWRWTVGLGIIPAAIAILLRLTIPETPRYYTDIKEYLSKAVKIAKKMYGKKVTNTDPTDSGHDSAEENEHWFRGAWDYLNGPEKKWKDLLNISLLWGIMDVAWYGLSMDQPSALSSLAYDPSSNSSSYSFDMSRRFIKRLNTTSCASSNTLWNTDCGRKTTPSTICCQITR